MARRTMKHNPAFLTEEELVRSFAVRHSELDLIMEVLRENTTDANQHLLLVGPRGIGKTMLALRAAAEVGRAPDLAEKWYPVVFGEESYQVSTPGEFWLEALFHLADQTQGARWQRTHQELSEEKDDDRLRQRALAQLMDFADEQGKRLLLVVENLNSLLGEQVSDDDAWVLRHTLLNEPRIMLLATATSWHDEIDNPGKAMFEVFRIRRLDPLDRSECAALWQAQTGQSPGDERIRPIQILTGGNPRLLTIVASFASELSLKQLLDDLLQLVDDHTAYFKSRLDGLPPTERKVYLALAEQWDPATAREVAEGARFEVNKASSLLRRLSDRGMVTVVGKEGRAQYYQISERMYNIYYLMRRRGSPSRRLKAVVSFMISFYEPEALVHATGHAADEVPQMLALKLRGCLDDTAEAVQLARSVLGQHPGDASFCNSFAWCFYEHGPTETLTRAEEWARKAVELEPANAAYRHTLGCILAVNGSAEEALTHAERYLADRETVENEPEDAAELMISLAAAGQGREALRVIEESESADLLEPLSVGIRLDLEEDVRIAQEIREVGEDVCERIRQKREDRARRTE